MKKTFAISLALVAAFALVFVAFRPQPETTASRAQDSTARHSKALAADVTLDSGGSGAPSRAGSQANPAVTQGAPGETKTASTSASEFETGGPSGATERAADTPLPSSEPGLTWLDHFKKANAFYEKREYESAAAAFEKALQTKEDNYFLHYMLGLSYWKDGRDERAAESLNTCLELKPDFTKAWVNLARVRRELGDPQEAVALCEKALTLDQANDDAWNVTGLAYLDMGERDKAREAFTDALAINAKNPYALNNLALTFIYEDRYGDALIPLEQAVALAPDVAFIRNNMGVVYEHLGRAAEAAHEYAAAADTPSGHPKAEASLKRILPLLSVEEEAKLAEFYHGQLK
jgi:tetratricopeptide (TPR) repeat protein